MPELPEVETVARGLRKSVVGRTILTVALGKTDFMDDPAAIELNLPGRRIEGVDRYGKFLLLRLSRAPGAEHDGAGLLVHLGMTGRLAPAEVDCLPEKHTHARFCLDDGRELRYTDARRFGRMAFLERAELENVFAPLGSEPLEVSRDDFCRRLRDRRARVKALLLNQGFLRGVGNIYADESLWRAKIHPTRLGATLNPKEGASLHRALQEVLRQAIAARGSSISDFLDGDGRPGEYQRRHRAYGREGKPCVRCGAKIRRAIVAGRSSFFCPRCQRAPRGRSETRRRERRV